jgi:hypothetical protein
LLVTNLIFDRSTFASSIRFQSVYFRLNWSISRCNARFFWMHRPAQIFIRFIFRSSRQFQIISFCENRYLFNRNTGPKSNFKKHRPSLIFHGSNFASLIQFQHVYCRPNQSTTRGNNRMFEVSPISKSEQSSWPSWKSRDLITSSGMSHTIDQSRNYSPYGH